MAGLAGLSLPVAGQTHDTTPPVLTAFSFTPSNPNATAGAAAVAFTVTATDDLSGVASIQILTTGPSGVQQATSWSGAGGLSATQMLTVSYPRYSAGGVWTVTSVAVRDAAGNTLVLATADLSAAAFPTTFTMQ